MAGSTMVPSLVISLVPELVNSRRCFHLPTNCLNNLCGDDLSLGLSAFPILDAKLTGFMHARTATSPTESTRPGIRKDLRGTLALASMKQNIFAHRAYTCYRG